MRKITFAFLFAGLATVSLSQVEKGRMMLGGGANYYSNTNQRLDTLGRVTQRQFDNHFNVNVRAGYFLFDNFLFGLTVGIGNNEMVTENENFIGSSISKSS